MERERQQREEETHGVTWSPFWWVVPAARVVRRWMLGREYAGKRGEGYGCGVARGGVEEVG